MSKLSLYFDYLLIKFNVFIEADYYTKKPPTFSSQEIYILLNYYLFKKGQNINKWLSLILPEIKLKF